MHADGQKVGWWTGPSHDPESDPHVTNEWYATAGLSTTMHIKVYCEKVERGNYFHGPSRTVNPICVDAECACPCHKIILPEGLF